MYVHNESGAAKRIFNAARRRARGLDQTGRLAWLPAPPRRLSRKEKLGEALRALGEKCGPRKSRGIFFAVAAKLAVHNGGFVMDVCAHTCFSVGFVPWQRRRVRRLR